MTVSLTIQKVSKTIQACTTLKNKQSHLISDVAEVIGILVSNFPGVDYGPLYYRALDRDKILALKAHRGNYNSPMLLSAQSLEELDWWIHNASQSKRHLLQHPNWDHPHLLHKKLHLMVCPLSGNPLENSIFLQKQKKLSWHHGEQGLKSNTRHTLRNTWTFVVNGVSITVNPM